MKTLIAFLITVVITISLTSSVFALDLGTGLVKDAAGQAGYDKNTNDTTLAELIGTIIKAALTLVGVIFTFLIAWAGNMWLGARGNEDEIEKAKKIITGSAMGLIITLAAYTISNFAVNAVLERAVGGG